MKCIIFTLFILATSTPMSAAPYRHRSAQTQAHAQAHPINHKHNHSQHHRQGIQNYTASTVTVLPVEYGDQEQEPSQEDEQETIEIKTPYKLTSHIITVQRIVDKFTKRIEEEDGMESESDSGADMDMDMDMNMDIDDEGVSSEDENEDEEDKIPSPSMMGNVSENPTMEELAAVKMGGEYREESKGEAEDRDGERDWDKRRGHNRQINGPGPDDEDSEGMVALMGWTALVGVVGILAIAPAG